MAKSKEKLAAGNATFAWYDKLNKPSWAPPRERFGQVWTALYPLILGSFGYALYRTVQGWYPLGVGELIILNLLFNAAFTPLQFNLRNNLLALIDAVAIDVTLIALIIAVWPYSKVVALVQLPYLAWILFATVLQAAIVRRNGARLAQPR